MHRSEPVFVPQHHTPKNELKWARGREVELNGVLYTIPPLTARGTQRAQDVMLQPYAGLQGQMLRLKKLQPKLAQLQSSDDKSPEELAVLMAELDEVNQILPEVHKLELESALQVGYIAFSMNYPSIDFEDYADLVSADQAREISQWVMAGEPSAKKD